ncbi:MAG: mannose-6-phosphate isomerase, class I [Phycisphaerales bacterium]|nr:mannose-6-phosphate isomerase, class I [Phycisphaerales bacterium]
MFKIAGVLQHYDWGGTTFLTQLLQLQPEQIPIKNAEYWVGAHPKGPSILLNSNCLGAEANLYELIKANPQGYLNAYVAKKFNNTLPYLFKILDVQQTLSIQVHPTKEQAQVCFMRENNLGMPLDAPDRQFKDNNHKPELMIALSDFWLLHGFKPPRELMATLHYYQHFHNLLCHFAHEDYEAFYRYIMGMPQPMVNAHLIPLLQEERVKKQNGTLTKNDPGWWSTKFYEGKELISIDRGIFSIYFFNLVYAQPGEAIFQKAGLPHAYLEGQNIEIMANSDNVLRGGLTSKKIDIDLLLQHIAFVPTNPQKYRPPKPEPDVINYPVPIDDFAISKINLSTQKSLSACTFSLEILFCYQGATTLMSDNNKQDYLSLQAGEFAMILPNSNYHIVAQQDAICFKAYVPRPIN